MDMAQDGCDRTRRWGNPCAQFWSQAASTSRQIIVLLLVIILMPEALTVIVAPESAAIRKHLAKTTSQLATEKMLEAESSSRRASQVARRPWQSGASETVTWLPLRNTFAEADHVE